MKFFQNKQNVFLISIILIIVLISIINSFTAHPEIRFFLMIFLLIIDFILIVLMVKSGLNTVNEKCDNFFCMKNIGFVMIFAFVLALLVYFLIF